MTNLQLLSPELATGPTIDITVPVAAAHVLLAWSTDQAAKAAHESGHLLASCATGFPCREVDLRGVGCAMVAIDECVDTVPATMTASRAFDRAVVTLAGRAAEIAILGQPTMGSAADLESATNLLLARAAAGADAGAPLISHRSFGGFGVFDLPTAVRDEITACVIATLRDCAAEADRIIAEHLDVTIELARILVRERRLSDDALHRELAALGLNPVPILR